MYFYRRCFLCKSYKKICISTSYKNNNLEIKTVLFLYIVWIKLG